MIYFGALLLLLIGAAGFAVVRTRDVTEQILALGFYGLLNALMFFVFQAPDVALSQITVGAVALPLMLMLAVSRMRFHAARERAKQQQAPAKGADDHA